MFVMIGWYGPSVLAGGGGEIRRGMKNETGEKGSR